MKLYYDKAAPEGEQWEIPGQQARKAERLDVPTTPVSLAAWLNERCVPADPGGALVISGEPLSIDGLEERLQQLASEPRKPMAPGFCPECGLSRAGTVKLAQGEDIETVIAWVETAEVWQLQRVADAIKDHVHALNEQLNERTVQ